MKRFVCLFALTALLLSACSSAEPVPTIPEKHFTQGIYQLTFNEKNLSNEGVGNDWVFTYTHQGQPIQSGYTITQDLGIFSFQSIDVEIREKDKIDDVATGSLAVALCDGGSGKTQLTVTETSSRYKGNAAIWEISCQVKLKEKR